MARLPSCATLPTWSGACANRCLSMRRPGIPPNQAEFFARMPTADRAGGVSNCTCLAATVTTPACRLSWFCTVVARTALTFDVFPISTQSRIARALSPCIPSSPATLEFVYAIAGAGGSTVRSVQVPARSKISGRSSSRSRRKSVSTSVGFTSPDYPPGVVWRWPPWSYITTGSRQGRRWRGCLIQKRPWPLLTRANPAQPSRRPRS